MPPQREPRIIRAERSSRRYQVVDKGPFGRGSPLSIEARGVLISLLMFPDDWEIRPAALARGLEIGRDRCYRILGELTEHGYLHRERTRDARGRIVWGDYILYEHPGDAPPRPENQEVEGVASGRQETPQRPLPETQEVVADPDPAPLPENQEMATRAPRAGKPPRPPLPELPDTDAPYTENQDAYRSSMGRNTKTNRGDPPPPPPTPTSGAQGGGGGGASADVLTGSAYLAGLGFSQACVRAFGGFPVEVLRADVERRRAGGQGLGAIYLAWRDCPPGSAPADEVPHAASDRPARRSPAAAPERPAGSGPPPGVNVITPELAAEWGIARGRPWPDEQT